MKTLNQVLLALFFVAFSTMGFAQSNTSYPPTGTVLIDDDKNDDNDDNDDDDDEDDEDGPIRDGSTSGAPSLQIGQTGNFGVRNDLWWLLRD